VLVHPVTGKLILLLLLLCFNVFRFIGVIVSKMRAKQYGVSVDDAKTVEGLVFVFAVVCLQFLNFLNVVG
jgi:hypothetical protein